MIEIVLADDHEVMRDGLKLLLESQPDMRVVAEASDVEAARRYVLGHHPTVLVLDINLGSESSLPAIPQIVERHPETAIVILTMESDPAFARQALASGALGYVPKQAAGEELVEAVRRAAGGEQYLDPELGAKVASLPVEDGAPDSLTTRELEILRLIVAGHTNGEIAEQLILSVRTVETHRANIQRKTGRTKRAELVRYAVEHDLAG